MTPTNKNAAMEFDFDGFDFSEFADLTTEQAEPKPEEPKQEVETVTEDEVPAVPVQAAPKKRKKTPAKAEVVAEIKPATDQGPAKVEKVDAAPVVAPAPVTPVNPQVLAQQGVRKLKEIETYLNARFVEREEVISNVIRTLAVGTNMLLLGEPGTGKSDLIQTANSLIEGATYFSWLVNRTSDPAELVGPYSIKEMENDNFVRKTEGKLPQAHVAFIDEIFKCNEPTLNMLLPVINEKIFYNGTSPQAIPLISMFAASNETPEDESLSALYDRLLIRMNVEYIKDSKNRQRMYQLYASKGAGILKPDNITLDELKAIQLVADAISIHADVFKGLDRLISSLKKGGIVISDRRQNNCIKIMRANAILEGRNQVIVQDLLALVYVLWEQEKDILVITEQINKIIDPFTDKLLKYVENYETATNNLSSIRDAEGESSPQFIQEAVIARKSIEAIVKRLMKLSADANKVGADTTKINYHLNEAQQSLKEITDVLLGVDVTEGGE